jgi:hypothetical protein
MVNFKVIIKFITKLVVIKLAIIKQVIINFKLIITINLVNKTI